MNNFSELKDLFFAPSVIIGPVRILFLIGFLFIIKRIISLRQSNQLGLDYIISRYSITISAIIIICFFLNLLSAFDLLSVIIISFLLTIFIFLNLDPKKSIWKQLKKVRKRIIIYSVKKVELNQRFLSTKNINKPKDYSKSDQIKIPKPLLYWQIAIAIGLAFTTFIHRYYFFLYDKYMLSDLWLKEYRILKNINIQEGYFNQISGEYALINLYSKITGLTDAIALQSFGLLESSILSVIIFWSVNKITKGHIVPALIAAISFIFFFNFLPFNIYLFTKHSSLYLAMSLTIPVIIYSSEPGSLRAKTSSYLKWMIILYFAISLTNLFVFLVVVPCFLIIVFFIIEKKHRAYFFRNTYAYLIAALSFAIFYFVIHLTKDENFIEFIKSNILVISSYTYSPQLILPITELMQLYWYISLTLVIVFLILSFLNRQLWRWSLAFNCFTTLLLSIYNYRFNFIDNDLMHLLATLIFPITFGCLLHILTYILRKLTPKLQIPIFIKTATAIVVCITILFLTRDHSNFPFNKTKPIKSEVLQAYNKISKSLLPHTHTIIDIKNHYDMSTNSHFFNNYTYFNNNYLKQDSIFFKNRLNKEYLKNNPAIALPESTFVFIYYTNEKNDIEQKNKSLKILSQLKNRGRQIEIFFKKPHLKVFEVINKPKSSKVLDLLL